MRTDGHMLQFALIVLDHVLYLCLFRLNCDLLFLALVFTCFQRYDLGWLLRKVIYTVISHGSGEGIKSVPYISHKPGGIGRLKTNHSLISNRH